MNIHEESAKLQQAIRDDIVMSSTDALCKHCAVPTFDRDCKSCDTIRELRKTLTVCIVLARKGLEA